MIRIDWKKLNGQLEAAIVDVTPEIAEEWLTKNHPSNRKIAKGQVEAFAHDMSTGNWKLTHQAIAFDITGQLIDGQHRLMAISKVQNGPIPMLIVRNREGAFDDPLDRGRPRTLGFIAQKHGRVIAAMNALRFLENGGYTTVPMTLAEANELLSRHDATLESLRHDIPGLTTMPGIFIGAAIYALPCAPAAVMKFIGQVITGEMLQVGDPAWAYRKWKERRLSTKGGWDAIMAATSALRAVVEGITLDKIQHGAETGYKYITVRRRVLKIDHTPGPDVVQLEDRK
jgi:hypothetical protein